MWIVHLEKTILKWLLILLGVIIILVGALHIYIVNNAESLIEALVRDQSNNRLGLKLEKIRFNYFSNKIVLENAAFYSVDSADTKISYRFTIKKINLRVKKLTAIFTKKELHIDSLSISSPVIAVTILKEPDSSVKAISISEQMGKIYNSIIDALTVLQVNRFELKDGKFILVNKTELVQKPLEITHLNFHVDNLLVDTSSHADFFVSDQMVFKTHDQDIAFPDGRHRLTFSRFRINIRKKLIEIDSCTITGRKPGNDRARFSVFLDTVKLINVDFNTLYHKEVIKADSLFCRNPSLKIDIQLRQGQKKKTSLPNMDTVIQQLTGDIELGYIGVSNAAVNINTYLNDDVTSFSSDKNNFEMTGLSIDHRRTNPVSLNGFSMAIHNYKTVLKDSSYFLRFDSIQLRQNKILLSNFSINTNPYKDDRNIKVRQFGLSGISWGDLLFNKKIIAQQAILLYPSIDYTQPAELKKKNKKAFLSSFNSINNIMNLDKIRVINGEVKIQTRNRLSILLQNADFLINSRNMDFSNSISHTEQSIDSLSFSKGIIKIKDISIDMYNARYEGDKNNLAIERISLYNLNQTFNIVARNVLVNAVNFNDTTNHLTAGAVSWKQAQVEVNQLNNKKGEKGSPIAIDLENMQGMNTQLNANIRNNSTSVFLNSLSANKISYHDKLEIKNFKTTGKNLNYASPESELMIAGFSYNDFALSLFSDLIIKQTKKANDIIIQAPEVSLIPDLQSILSGNSTIRNFKITNPEITIQVKEEQNSEQSNKLPNINIDKLELSHPVFKVENATSSGLRSLYWNGSNKSLIATNIRTNTETNELNIGNLNTDISDLSFTDNKNKPYSTKEGFLKTEISDIVIRPENKLYWKFLITKMEGKDLTVDSFGKKPMFARLDNMTINNLALGSEYISNLKELATRNSAYSIKNLSVHFRNEKTNWSFQNISFTKPDNNLSLDSFSIFPLLERDSFIAASPFQTDYMTFHFGKIDMSNFNPDHYFIDSSIRIHTITVRDPYFTSYRDKRPPFKEGIFKPLPSKLIQRIPFKLSVDTIKISDGTVVYSELNDKTKDTTIIPVKRISGDIFPIKNFGIATTDSLRIRLNGYLLDSAWIRLRTRESYADSLSGFLITVRLRPRSLIYLNELLASLVSVKLQSGYLDTLTMRAIAKNDYAFGEMKMFYHGLKVQFFSNGNESKTNFLTRLKTFIANSFIIKNKNTKRSGIVYFSRLKDRSFINYYIKTFMSGIASAIGAKNPKKMLRRYQKELRQRNLPPIDSDY